MPRTTASAAALYPSDGLVLKGLCRHNIEVRQQKEQRHEAHNDTVKGEAGVSVVATSAWGIGVGKPS